MSATSSSAIPAPPSSSQCHRGRWGRGGGGPAEPGRGAGAKVMASFWAAGSGSCSIPHRAAIRTVRAEDGARGVLRTAARGPPPTGFTSRPRRAGRVPSCRIGNLQTMIVTADPGPVGSPTSKDGAGFWARSTLRYTLTAGERTEAALPALEGADALIGRTVQADDLLRVFIHPRLDAAQTWGASSRGWMNTRSTSSACTVRVFIHPRLDAAQTWGATCVALDLRFAEGG